MAAVLQESVLLGHTPVNVDRHQMCWFGTTHIIPRYSTKTKNEKDEAVDIDNVPIKFSTSGAYKHLAKTSRQGGDHSRLEYEGEVVILSLATFLIYFTIIREENDIDKELDRTLYSRIDGLEELQLKLSLKYNQENGLDTKAIEDRLAEIEKHKRELAENGEAEDVKQI